MATPARTTAAMLSFGNTRRVRGALSATETTTMTARNASTS